MATYSITEAKKRLAELVRQAEGGRVVRITRRGRRVAVLVSDRDFTRLERPRRKITDHLADWRKEMRKRGIAFATDADFVGLRDKSCVDPMIQK
ncbi:MAG: type II toxin-antitoxin system Phd/YefM family antitoxin [Alphaproteobacteria bacterium]|nr:type II toxin-antitoxin system Phd/YefM family antitoxin [Alphaproteobacteria bacterium]